MHFSKKHIFLAVWFEEKCANVIYEEGTVIKIYIRFICREVRLHMTAKEMLGKVDHTQLKAFATWEDIVKLCDEAVEYQTASVCVPLRILRESMILMEIR